MERPRPAGRMTGRGRFKTWPRDMGARDTGLGAHRCGGGEALKDMFEVDMLFATCPQVHASGCVASHRAARARFGWCPSSRQYAPRPRLAGLRARARSCCDSPSARARASWTFARSSTVARGSARSSRGSACVGRPRASLELREAEQRRGEVGVQRAEGPALAAPARARGGAAPPRSGRGSSQRAPRPLRASARWCDSVPSVCSRSASARSWASRASSGRPRAARCCQAGEDAVGDRIAGADDARLAQRQRPLVGVLRLLEAAEAGQRDAEVVEREGVGRVLEAQDLLAQGERPLVGLARSPRSGRAPAGARPRGC